LDGAKDVPVSKDMFFRSILPIGLLFSGSLILSNTAYLYLSVAYIQMLKVRSSQAYVLSLSHFWRHAFDNLPISVTSV
jgi:hypothetical protein